MKKLKLKAKQVGTCQVTGTMTRSPLVYQTLKLGVENSNSVQRAFDDFQSDGGFANLAQVKNSIQLQPGLMSKTAVILSHGVSTYLVCHLL